MYEGETCGHLPYLELKNRNIKITSLIKYLKYKINVLYQLYFTGD